jgi:succinylglutamate desuccinylase
MKFKKVLVFGGTHGNEWTGIGIVENYRDYFQKKYPNLTLEFILANPEAHKINKRFKDEDLNRAFQFLNEDRKNSYEHVRAREIRELITSEDCYVIDLHTTTSNMGKTIIISDYHPYNLQLCSRLKEKIAGCKMIGSPDPGKKYLASQTKFGLILEVGPTPNGLINPIVMEETLLLLDQILAEISATENSEKGSLEVYEEIQNVNYPTNSRGEISSYIHSSFQGKDFQPVKGDYTAFRSFQQQDITLKTSEELYPIFINEAAYYPQQLAFTLCRKTILTF